MESKQTKVGHKFEKKIYHKKSEIDSSISLNFDSGTDIGYKSGELSSVLSPTESLSPKSEQNLRFDSGLGTDCFTPVSSENYPIFSEDIPISDVDKKSSKSPVQEIYLQDKDGDTMLHLAIVEAMSDVIFPFVRLASFPDLLDIRNDLSQTPLHLAALTGKPNIVRRLVVAGAALDIQDRTGNSALHIACQKGDLDCVQAILQPITTAELREAQCLYKVYLQDQSLAHLINSKNFEGQTCVHLAAFGGFKKVLECLNDHGADIDNQDGKSGKTGLHYAIEQGNYDLVCLLLAKCHANPFVKNYAGQTSFHIAYTLCKKFSSKTRRTILEVLRKNVDRWESPSDSDNSSSSDETETLDCTLQSNHHS